MLFFFLLLLFFVCNVGGCGDLFVVCMWDKGIGCSDICVVLCMLFFNSRWDNVLLCYMVGGNVVFSLEWSVIV